MIKKNIDASLVVITTVYLEENAEKILYIFVAADIMTAF